MSHVTRFPILVALAVAACSRPSRPPVPGPLGTVDSVVGDSKPHYAPPGWAQAGDVPASFMMGIDSSVAHGGGASAFIEAARTPPRGSWGALLQEVDASRFAGQRIRVSAFIRRQGTGTCEAFVRVDGPGDSQAVVLAFAGTAQKQLRCGQQWSEYSLVLDVPDSAERVVYAYGLRSRGKMWVDDVGVIVVDSTVPLDRQPEGLPRAASPMKGETWDPFLIGGKEKPDSTAVPTNLSFEK